jgi:tetratricopeptide (TPR) repeat protein
MEYRLEGYRYQEKGDLDNAIIYYRKAVDEDGTYATAHNDLGVVYEQRGMYDAAERSYLRALKAHPDYKGSYSNLAYLYENKGDESGRVTGEDPLLEQHWNKLLHR